MGLETRPFGGNDHKFLDAGKVKSTAVCKRIVCGFNRNSRIPLLNSIHRTWPIIGYSREVGIYKQNSSVFTLTHYSLINNIDTEYRHVDIFYHSRLKFVV